MKDKNIFLIGFMGAGKSTIGKLLANSLNIPFFDTDEIIANNESQTISEIFTTKGEDHFRQLEQSSLQELIKLKKPAVISTGGGLPCFFSNMNDMNQNGITVYLKCDVSIIAQRLLADETKRPLLEKISAEELHEEIKIKLEPRLPIYELASITVDANQLEEEIVKEILLKIKPLVEE